MIGSQNVDLSRFVSRLFVQVFRAVSIVEFIYIFTHMRILLDYVGKFMSRSMEYDAS